MLQRLLNLRFLLAVMLMASVQAGSYFARSDGWGNLWGTHPEAVEAIGFPFLMWETYGSRPIPDPLRVNLNFWISIGAAAFITWLSGVLLKTTAKRLSIRNGAGEGVGLEGLRLRFSIRDMLIATTAIAITLMLFGKVNQWRSGALLSIYALGPALLALLAVGMQSRPRLQMRFLVSLLIGTLAFAFYLAETHPSIRDGTRGLLGIFVCWTPQFLVLIGAAMWMENRRARIDA